MFTSLELVLHVVLELLLLEVLGVLELVLKEVNSLILLQKLFLLILLLAPPFQDPDEAPKGVQ